MLFLLPTLLYVGYVLLTRGVAANGKFLDEAPLIWLSVAGALLVILVLIAFGSTSGGRPDQHYEPPSMKNGHIEPGRIR
ncbi:MAG: DUF6111 family protein [Bacteroidota bacterium]